MASKDLCLTDSVNEYNCLTEPSDTIVTESPLSFGEVEPDTYIQPSHSFSSDISLGLLEKNLHDNQLVDFVAEGKEVSCVTDTVDRNVQHDTVAATCVLPRIGLGTIERNIYLNKNDCCKKASVRSHIKEEQCDQNCLPQNEVLFTKIKLEKKLSADNLSLDINHDCADLYGDIDSHIDNIVDKILLQVNDKSGYEGESRCHDSLLQSDENNSDACNTSNTGECSISEKKICCDAGFLNSDEGTLRHICQNYSIIKCFDETVREIDNSSIPIIYKEDISNPFLTDNCSSVSQISKGSIENHCTAAETKVENSNQCVQLFKSDMHNLFQSGSMKISVDNKSTFFCLADKEIYDEFNFPLEKVERAEDTTILTQTKSGNQDALNTLSSNEVSSDQNNLSFSSSCDPSLIEDQKNDHIILDVDESCGGEEVNSLLKENKNFGKVMFDFLHIDPNCDQDVFDAPIFKAKSGEPSGVDISFLEKIHSVIGTTAYHESCILPSDSNGNVVETLSQASERLVDNCEAGINNHENPCISSFIKNLPQGEESNIEFSDILSSGSPMLRRSRSSDSDNRIDCRFIFNESFEEIETSAKITMATETSSLVTEEHFVPKTEKPVSITEETSIKIFEERPQYRSLRDSLDFVKQGKIISDASNKVKENRSVKSDFENSAYDEPEESLVLKEMLPRLTKLSYKKKASLGGDRSCFKGRRVSFPEEEDKLITSYLEPANPWHYMSNVTNDSIAEAYQSSCQRYNTRLLPQVLQQIVALPINAGSRIERLSLKNCKLEASQIECLEEIFRRVQFKVLDFEECELDDDTSIPLLDMIEFYDSATHLNIASNTKIGSRGWQACARMLKRTPSLQVLNARNTNLNEQNMPLLCRALRLGTRLSVLHIENCNLTGRPLINLAGALRLNDTISELYLADNHLGVTDSIQLGNVVRSNKILKFLDLRNNNIQDTGCAHICKDIAEQQTLLKHTLSHVGEKEAKVGITNLNLWNNHLTVNSISSISSMLCVNFTLETLNIGRNCITSEGILLLKTSLMRNKNLLRLGLQATRIGNEGVVALAECIADNSVIARIDLRENSIQVAGLMALSRSLQMNSSVVQVDLEFNPRAEPTSDLSDQHMHLQHEIKSLCSKNMTNAHAKGTILQEKVKTKDTHEMCESPDSRKISLTCEVSHSNILKEEDKPNLQLGWNASETRRYRSPEPSPCPSPSLSPSPSPVPSPMRNRFKVFKVAEEGSNILSTSAPASMSLGHSMSGSLPSLITAGAAPNRFMTSKRFTVTKVSDASLSFQSGLQANRAMSSPSLITHIEDSNEGPTIVVSSPNKAVRGFSVDDSGAEIPSAQGGFDPIYIKERSNSFDINVSKSLNLESPSSDDVFESSSSTSILVNKPQVISVAERKHVVYGPPVNCFPPKAPLASIEAGSFDSDSEDSEITTQSSDSTHSDEVRISSAEQVSPKMAWEDEKK